MQCSSVSKSILILRVDWSYTDKGGPQRPGEDSRTKLEKNPVKLERNSSEEKSSETREFFSFHISSAAVFGELKKGISVIGGTSLSVDIAVGLCSEWRYTIDIIFKLILFSR